MQDISNALFVLLSNVIKKFEFTNNTNIKG